MRLVYSFTRLNPALKFGCIPLALHHIMQNFKRIDFEERQYQFSGTSEVWQKSYNTTLQLSTKKQNL